MNGPDEYLACPNDEEASSYRDIEKDDLQKLATYKFNCTATNGSVVPVLAALDGTMAGPREMRPSKYPNLPKKKKKGMPLPPGVMAGELGPGVVGGWEGLVGLGAGEDVYLMQRGVKCE